MASPTGCNANATLGTALSSVIVEVITLFMEHDTLQYFSERKRINAAFPGSIFQSKIQQLY